MNSDDKKLNPFQQAIKKYLDERAANDELFAVTYAKENKSIEECCNYVMKCAKDGGRQGYTDDEVFGWAVHYYDEDDIKNIASISGKVIVNSAIELTEEDKALAKEKAMQQLIDEAKEEARQKLSETVELTDEDVKIAKEKAIEKAVEEQKQKMTQKKTAKKKDPKPEVEQDLFSI